MAYSNTRKEPVALKIIWKNRASKAFQKYFLPREIDIVKELRHPNIIRYFQYIETNRRLLTPHVFKNLLRSCCLKKLAYGQGDKSAFSSSEF